MSDKELEEGPVGEQSPDNEVEAEAQLEPEAEPEPEPEPAAPQPAKRQGAGIAWLALFVAILATAFAGYGEFRDWQEQRSASNAPDPLADIRNRIATSNETLTGLDAALAQLEAADASAATQLATIQGDVEQRLQLMDSLPPRMTNLEKSLSALQGISADTRNSWLIAEAEYYMQIANAQLQLAGNPYLAALALGMADERIVQLADPALTGVRRALADELAALEGMAKPDVEGITLKLASLAKVVQTIPLLHVTSDAAEQASEPDAQTSGVDRAWASVKGAVGGLVRHSKPGDSALPLMTPEAEYFLRTNLALQFQSARLALLQGEQAVFEQSLDDAHVWLGDYFDVESTQVASAIGTISEIRAASVAVAKPDISQSLRLLRQFQALTEPAQ